jgi:hypothetical protein
MDDERHGSPWQGVAFDPDSKAIARSSRTERGVPKGAATKGTPDGQPRSGADAGKPDDTNLLAKAAEPPEEGSGDPGLTWGGGGGHA